MKTTHLFATIPALVATLLFSPPSPAVAQLQRPVIQSIQPDGSDIVVQVQVPSGVRRVTLEGRERAGRQSWEPRAVARLDGSGGTITFRLARTQKLALLRVRGDATEPLPTAFYAGTNSFLGEVVAATDGTAATPGSFVTYSSLDNRTDLTATPTASEGDSREVVESDIWKIRGQTLYFFNQYRGLQIIDLSNPDNPVVRGTLALPAAGEQMYLLGTDHVVLLARDGCNYAQSQVLVVADLPAGPQVVASLPVTGTIQESRMVGTALYVASQLYRSVANSSGTTWEWGTQVAAFDLSDPSAPVARNTLWYAGYGNVVASTDICFFIATQNVNNYWQSTVGIIDITSPDGTMNRYGSVTTAGRVQDKFKLNYRAGVLTAISEDWHWDGGQRLVTKLETFRVPDPRSLGPLGIGKLGELELGRGERLRATRFDGDRVYVVTFFQIDPLWVVSLANPARPEIVGSVEIPGWSTYIEPLGDRLVTVGVETNRVAVSLFDVSDPAAPTLASRVLLGETHSWSEANYDEKAFTVLPDANLILVPFNGDVTNAYVSAVQLIDLNRDTLVARGQITGAFGFRRSTVYRDRILSISGWELATVDATDRDQPEVVNRLELAWTIDRVFLSGDFLIEVQNGASWDNFNGPALRVALAADPDTMLGELTLTNLPILGATLKGEQLYVAQGQGGYIYPLPLVGTANGATTDDSPDNPPNFVLTVVNLDNLPALRVAGQTARYDPNLGWGSDWQAVWPKPDVLVWAGGGYGYYRWYYPMPVMPLTGVPVAGGGMVADARLIMPWPYWGGTGGQLITFDVSDPTAPQFASEVNLTTNNWWSFSKAFAADGKVYLSHQTSECLDAKLQPVSDPEGNTTVSDGTVAPSGGVVYPIRYWVQRSYLDVVDYENPTDPRVRRPVSLPNTLTGIGHEGDLLYTTGPHWNNSTAYDGTEYLDALAYDGVSAHLVDSLVLSNLWPHPVLVVGPNIFVGRPTSTVNSADAAANSLENWTLSATGNFERLSSVQLGSPANVLREFSGLLAVQENDSTVELFAIGNATALPRVGSGQPGGCTWFDLSRADGDLMRGLWVPLGLYGVGQVPVKP